MPCRTCLYWHADEQPEKSMRGYCGNARADKSGNRTVFDYSCREHASRPNPVAADEGASYDFTDPDQNPWLLSRQEADRVLVIRR